MTQTLRREHRLTSSLLYRETMDRGRVFRGKNFVLFCHVSETGAPTQVGFFASRRVGGAVKRNRAKRRLREAYRRLRETVRQNGILLVFQARKETDESPPKEVMEEMELVFQRAGVSLGTPGKGSPGV